MQLWSGSQKIRHDQIGLVRGQDGMPVGGGPRKVRGGSGGRVGRARSTATEERYRSVTDWLVRERHTAHEAEEEEETVWSRALLCVCVGGESEAKTVGWSTEQGEGGKRYGG